MKFTDTILSTSIFSILAYFVGSISFAYLFSKMRGVDIKKVGSGNAGATNVTRALGKKAGALILLLDMCKPAISMGIALGFSNIDSLATNDISLQVVGLFSIIGHIYSIFLGFKGGKGAASTAGYYTATNWLAFPIGFSLFIGIMKKSKMVSIASMASIFLLAFIVLGISYTPVINDGWFQLFFSKDQRWVTFASHIFLSLLMMWSHRSNIKRIFNGTENKIKSK